MIFRYFLAGLLVIFMTGNVQSHEVGALGLRNIDWQTKEISRVISPSYAMNDLGVRALAAAGKKMMLDGDTCLRGHQFNLDINDNYAFDIDETVRLTLEIDVATSGPDILIAYDRNGGPGHLYTALTTSAGKRKTVNITLPRARFANRGDHGTDVKIVGQPTLDNFWNDTPGAPLTICNIAVERSYKTTYPDNFGWLELNIVDETGAPAAIRAGIYDETGRSALPSTDAIVIKKFSDRTRTILLGAQNIWPVDNHFAFYLDGRYYVRLPSGRHHLVGSRGIEYKMFNEWLDIKAGQTLVKTMKLDRFANLKKTGWYSGDVHIHSARRDGRDGAAMLRQIMAEDLNVGNLLQMGNVGATHFPQMGWGKTGGRVQQGNHALVSGQEGPRTIISGHIISLNINSPVRFPDRYFQYQAVFEEVARQGGLSGYAHVGYNDPGTIVGMALDVPLGNVKFAEIAQGGVIGTDNWFDFLNLGYQIAAAAGTDYPYLDHPGAYRTYVQMRGDYSVDGWFDGLKAGRSFVTNGPLLDVNVNGRIPGERLELSKGDMIRIKASAGLNPDIGSLARLELIIHGDVMATVEAEGDDAHIILEHEISATDSSWLVVRAVGKDTGARKIMAVSSPVYIIVDDDTRTWKRAAVRNIVAGLSARLDALAGLGSTIITDLELWQTNPVWTKTWDTQIRLLEDRISVAKAKLRALAENTP